MFKKKCYRFFGGEEANTLPSCQFSLLTLSNIIHCSLCTVTFASCCISLQKYLEIEDETILLAEYLPFCGILSCNLSTVIILWKC